MKLIKQTAEIWDQNNDELGIYKAIERAARLCYRSENRIDATSYERIIERLKLNKHFSPMEHGTVYLKIPIEEYEKNYKNKYFPQK